MANVLVVLAPGAEEIETVTVADVLVRAGQEVTVASTVPGPLVIGSRGIPLGAHTTLDATLSRTWDLVYLPGGKAGAQALRDDPRVQDLIRGQLAAQRWLALICASPIALLPRDLAHGRTLTSSPTVRPQVEPHAGQWIDQPVVFDGKLVTSQGPGTALALGLALAQVLAGESVAVKVAKEMLASPPAGG